MKSKGGGWTEGGFTFTAEAEREIRRAFGFSHNRFPDHGKAAVIRSVTGALAKVKGDETERKTDPRVAGDRAAKIEKLLKMAAARIVKMAEMEQNSFDPALTGDSGAVGELAATLDRAAAGFRKAAGKRAKKVAELLKKAGAEISQMSETERDVFSAANGGDRIPLADLVATLEGAAMGFQKAAEGHALRRGEKVAGSAAVSMFVAAQVAVAWRAAFGIEPVEHDGSDFVTVLQAILYNAGLPELGEAAIETAIKGPPKSRERRSGGLIR